MNTLEPTKEELRALEVFRSRDTTRPGIARVWVYRTEDGVSHVATDGHTLALRRAGSHRTMSPDAVGKLSLCDVGTDTARPPQWWHCIKVPWLEGKSPLAQHGINVTYLARIALIEAAAAKRSASELVREPRESQKVFRARKVHARRYFAVWTIPADAFDGWYYKLDTPACLWEGIIMPRRV